MSEQFKDAISQIMNRAEQAGNYILNRMRNELDSRLSYHNVPHVLDVLQAAEMIGRSENISEEEMELLRVAVLFHDSGFLNGGENHEETGCRIAMEVLPGFGFSQPEIQTICRLIMVTHVPQHPQTLLEKIICDADLDYLGRDDFFTTGRNMYAEFRARNMVQDERDWNELQVRFLSSHKYFTQTSLKLRSAKKEEHLAAIRQMLGEKV
jgi:uncharacterized protein